MMLFKKTGWFQMYIIATNEAAVIFQLDPYAIDTIGMNE